MLFNSPVYIFLFLPVVFAGYFGLNRLRMFVPARVWLVGASFFFYGYWKPVYLILIIASILVNFSIGVSLHRTKASTSPPVSRKGILAAGLTFNIGLLGYFKYSAFFLSNMSAWTGAGIAAINITLPLAISFFTFQQIAYLVDCYQADTQEYDFLSYCLFVTFFPQLIAGPIVHHKEMMPQFAEGSGRSLNLSNITAGLHIFAIGLFKKTVIADTLATWANAGFDSGGALTLFDAWTASLSYTLQIYFDFSGYTDMAIGAALLFNIRLPVNFNSPYKACDIRDFWRRWHMTLSRWLRDYIYIPLGGNRRGGSRTYVNILVTFLLGGLWHGAGWTFIAWGAMHGLAMVAHRYWHRSGRAMNPVAGWFGTFMFVNATWVFFRAESFGDALRVLRGMAGLSGTGAGAILPDTYSYLAGLPVSLGLPALEQAAVFWPAAMIAACLVVAALFRNTVQQIGFIGIHESKGFSPTLIKGLLAGLMAGAAVTTMLLAKSTEFLYFNF